MIQIVFTNGSQSVELKYVRSIQWESQAAEDAFVSQTTRVGARKRIVKVSGFINKSIFNSNISAQQQLETDLIAVGTGTVQCTGATDIQNCRFTSVEFEEFRGNPVCGFTVSFMTEDSNVHAHLPIKIGSLTLNPSSGFEYATVSDTILTQGPDEQLVNNKARTFVIEGMFIGSTLDEVNTAQANLVAEVENKTTLVITLSSSVGPFSGIYTVRPGKLEFGSPRLKDNQTARSFSFECKTFEDYSKEPFTLGEVAQSFAGITIDVVEGIDHNRESDKLNAGPTYATKTEELVISGKRYFANWTAYTSFVNLFRPIPFNTYYFGSSSGASLELQDVDIGKFDRDGNDLTGAKRYSASVTLTFRWEVGLEGKTYEINQFHFGMSWYKVSNVSFNTSIDEYGNVSSKGVSISGSVLGPSGLAAAKSKLGGKFNYTDSTVTLDDVYVTSVSVNSVETQNISGSTVQIYSITISAQQLDNASQAASFIRSLFRFNKAGGSGTSYTADTIQFENVTSFNKSISNRWDILQQKFIATSMTISISGEVWDVDQNGSPASPNKMLDLFNKIDALLNAQLSTRTANTVPSGETLPNNTNIHYFLSNFSLGQWQSFTKQVGTGAGSRYWKQTVSLTATAVFDLNSNNVTEPDSVESKSYSYEEESPKYAQLQVLGFGTVFKRVGTNPAKEVVTYQKQFRDKKVFVAEDYGSDDTSRVRIPTAKSVITRDVKENRGLVNRHIVEYSANDKIS